MSARKWLTLGVLTATADGDQRRLGPQTISFKWLARIGAQAGVRVLVFKPEDVAASHRSLRGYVYDVSRAAWRRVVTRWPDVIYNRVASRSVERRDDIQRTLQRFQQAGVPVFNPGFLDKWTVYRVLARDERTRQHLPRFRRIRRAADVRRALARWRAIFLKPVGGSLGKGIIFLCRSRRGYRYHAYLDGRYRKGERRDWQAIASLLEQHLCRQTYLAQAAVERALLHGAPFDVRVLVQKGADLRWHISGMTARRAAPGRVLTHTPRGGTPWDLRHALEIAFRGRLPVDTLLADLARVARRAAEVIDVHYAGSYGELSVDLTLDRSGYVWILECNAKPARFDERTIELRHLRRLIEFAQGIARCGGPAGA